MNEKMADRIRRHADEERRALQAADAAQIRAIAQSTAMSEDNVRRALADITKAVSAPSVDESMAELSKNMAQAVGQGVRASAEAISKMADQLAVQEQARAKAAAAAKRKPNAEQRRAQLEGDFSEFVSKHGLQNNRRVNEQAFAIELRRLNEPIEGWPSPTLLSQLPEKARAAGDFPALTAWQVMCLAEYSRRNCSTPSPSTYEAGLILEIVPELLRRLEARLREAPPRTSPELVTFRAAWELYRSGAATFEEIGPLMDKAMADSDKPAGVPELPSAQPVKLAIPYEIGKRLGSFMYASKTYKVVAWEEGPKGCRAKIVMVDDPNQAEYWVEATSL